MGGVNRQGGSSELKGCWRQAICQYLLLGESVHYRTVERELINGSLRRIPLEQTALVIVDAYQYLSIPHLEAYNLVFYLNTQQSQSNSLPAAPAQPPTHRSPSAREFAPKKALNKFLDDYKEGWRHILMIMRNLLLALLMLVGWGAGQGENFFLSPPMPPTAFVGEYYTTQFRVLGLDNPEFSFVGLPQCFRGGSDGTIEGTPDKAGSYAAKVIFKSSKNKGSRDIVVRVAPSVSSSQQSRSEGSSLAENKFVVLNPTNSLIYAVGDRIDFSLMARNGLAPYTWNFLNLPAQLKGEQSGKLTGVFDQEGYYSFSASCSDGSGSNADSYVTLNIQPRLFKGSNLIEVPNRNAPVSYDFKQVESQQMAATNAVYAAISIVDQNQKDTAAKRERQAKSQLTLEFANKQMDNANSKASVAGNTRKLAQTAAIKAHDVLEKAAKTLALARTALTNADEQAASAHQGLTNAREKLTRVITEIRKVNNKFINAQTETGQSAQNAKSALTANTNARNVYNLAFDSFSKGKAILHDTQERKAMSDRIVDSSRDSLNAANQANDDALSELTAAQSIFEKIYAAMNNSNALVNKLREMLNARGDELGVAKFNLQQALNRLYVAQAMKEQADKATAIVRAQSSVLPDYNSTSSLIFAGCQQLAYPTVMGTARIESSNAVGYRLATGSTLLFGSCTVRESCQAGDLVSYSGYLKDGYIHALSIAKTAFPKK